MLFSESELSVNANQDSKVNSVRFRKRDERLKRVVEARVKGEKEKEQEKKKKIEEKMAQLEKKNDMVLKTLRLGGNPHPTF